MARVGEHDTTDLEARAATLTVAAVSEDRFRTHRLEALLSEEGLRVIEARSPDELMAVCGGHAPDVAVLLWDRFEPEDAAWFGVLHRELPGIRLVGVAATADIRAIRAAVGAGAHGFLLETHVEGSLAWSVRAVCSGLLCLPQEFARYVARPVLSVREKQILGMVVLGFSNGEIARKLYLAESTVKSHLTSAFSKLGVRSRNEATDLILDADSGLGPGILAIVDDEALGPSR